MEFEGSWTCLLCGRPYEAERPSEPERRISVLKVHRRRESTVAA
jgi:hypothetical protein